MTKASVVPKARFFPVRAVKDDLRISEQRQVEKDALAALVASSRGLEVFYMKFASQDRTYALHSRMNPKQGTLDVEYDFISAGMSDKIITQDDHRRVVLGSKNRRPGRGSSFQQDALDAE